VNVFDTLPRDFFRPLAAKGAEVYLNVLFTIWEAQRFNPLLERTTLLSHIHDILLHPDALQATEEDIRENAERSGRAIGSTTSDRAGEIILYLLQRGWLREEEPTEFVRVYTLPHYAQKVLEVLSAIGSRESLRIRGLVYSIRELLVPAATGEDIEVRVPEAYRQTLQLRSGLSELQDRMREHIQQVAQQKQTSKVLAHLSGYYDLVSDVSYKQLKTTDHVSRFRPQISDAIAKLDDGQRLLPVARKMHALGEASTESEALHQLEGEIAFIREQFEILHAHLSTLDELNSRYTDTVTQAVQRDIYAQSTISGRFQTFLQEKLHTRVLRDDEVSEDIKELIDLFTFSYVEGNSLSSPKSAPHLFSGDEAPAVERIEPQEKGEVNAEMFSQLRDASIMSRGEIAQFVLRQLHDRQEMCASEIPLKDVKVDMPRIMLIWAYGDGSLGYYVCQLPDTSWIENVELNLGLQDFLICKGHSQKEKRK